MWCSFLLWMIFSHFCLQTAETLGIQNEHPCQWAPYRHQRSFKLVFHDVLYPDAPLWAGCHPGSLGFSRLHFYWGKPSPWGSQLARLSEWGSGDAFVYLMMFLFVCLFVGFFQVGLSRILLWAIKTMCFPLNFFFNSLTSWTWTFWKHFSWGIGTKIIVFRPTPTLFYGSSIQPW